MKSAWQSCTRAVRWFNGLMGYLSAIIIVVCTISLTYEVLVRYFFKAPTEWSLEFNIFMLIAATFFAAAHTQDKRGHVGIGVLDGVMSKRWNRWRYLLVDVLSLALCAFVTYFTWKHFYMVWTQGWVTESTWAPKLWIPYFSMAFGLTTLVIQYLVQIVDERIMPLCKGETDGSV